MYYNTLFSLPLSALLLMAKYETDLGPVLEYALWWDPGFVLSFGLSAVMGFVLNYSIVFCTKMNSPLTTTVTGSLKNIFSTYLGMMMGDYSFTWANFMGLNLSVLGSLVYSYVKFKDQKPKGPQTSGKQVQMQELPPPVTHRDQDNQGSQ